MAPYTRRAPAATLPARSRRTCPGNEAEAPKKIGGQAYNCSPLILTGKSHIFSRNGESRMRRTIYHGSVSVIEKPVFGAGNRANDYGLGFYCTENADLAMEWAVRRDHDGWANEYEIDDDGLAVLNLGDPQYCILHWLAVLLENRQFETEYGLPSEAKAYLSEHFAVPYKTADIIVGYRADDSYFTFAQDFISGAISYSQLSKAMRLGRLGNQYVL